MLCLLFFQFSNAQKQTIEQKLKANKAVSEFTLNALLKTPSSILFTSAANLSASRATAVIQDLFDLNAQNDLRLVNSTELKNGVRIEKYKQYFKGVRVEHSTYNVVSKNGVIYSITAESYPLEDAFSIAPQLATENAKSKALDFVGARTYSWEAIENDKRLYPGNTYMQMQIDALKQQYTPKGELVIARDVYGTQGPRLAYKFDIYAVEPLSRAYVYVDAMNGNILLNDPIIKHTEKTKKDPKPDSLNYIPNFQYYALAEKEQFRYSSPKTTTSVVGTGLTRYAGVRQINTTRVVVPLTGAQDPNNPSVALAYSGIDPRVPVANDTVFILKDDTRGGLSTFDMNGIGDGNTLGNAGFTLTGIHQVGLAFVDRDNNWKDEIDNGVVTREDLKRGATSNGSVGADESKNDDIAIDAHWGASVVYDYWKQIHNRQSFDNRNSAIRSFVHYDIAYDNAYWNGSVMTYGDGSGTSATNPVIGIGFRPLTSLDVCAHEIGHGVCSFTSDLVYANESGAMNEGLSDIWAACVERFAKTKIDNTLNYQYFQVGEQIAADNEGLRRMDNPKRYSDPDTYKGRYWYSGTGDNGGVHTNSGVLNKWFYLLVQGPSTTTGSPAYTDDGKADAGSTAPLENLGNNYGALPGFAGLGFDKAEQIVYLMEQNLTPNATYAEARAASINAAKVLFGPCSQEEISVTDAWFGVGVGAAWTTCTTPPFSITTLTSLTVTEGSGDCGTYSEIPFGISLAVPQAAPVTISFTLAAGSTVEDHDYQVSTNAITFNAGETGYRPFVVRIFNDDYVEGDEILKLNVNSPLKDTTLTITIKDDDVMPRLGNVFTLLSENFDNVPDNSLPMGWDSVSKVSPSGGEWNVRQSPGVTPITWLTKRAYIYAPLLGDAGKGQPQYDNLTPSEIILRTPLIDARGFDSVKLHFIWSAGGEAACDPACDYGQVVYSFDGVTFNRFNADTSDGAGNPSQPLYMSPNDSTYNQVLGKVVSNRQFYLGFRWINDANGTTFPASITIDSVIVSGIGRKIETDSASATTTLVGIEPGAPVFFYSKDDKGLLSRMINANAELGCVKDTLIQSGNGTVAYSGGRRTKKVHEITASQNTNATYTLTLYYTTGELAGFTAAPSQLKILKSNAANIDNSVASNSVVVTPSEFIDSSSQGFYGYSYTFDGFSKFALVEPSLSPLPVNCLDFKATKGADNVMLNWKVANDAAGTFYQIERSSDGANFQNLGNASANGSGQYNYSDHSIGGLKGAYYRIKAVEANGSYHYLCTVLFVNFDGRNVFTIGNIYPNPGKGDAAVNITSGDAYKLRIEYVNVAGQVINWQNEQVAAGAGRINLKVNALAAGSYLIRFKDAEGRIINTQQFIKQ